MDAPTTDQPRARQKAGRAVEERNRGKRLFGALLGTLAQSSSSTAQKRRASIEKKQRDKLRQQAEEDDENRVQRLEKLKQSRLKEQWKWNRQSVCHTGWMESKSLADIFMQMSTKHSNVLAMANFLQTKTEPRLV